MFKTRYKIRDWSPWIMPHRYLVAMYRPWWCPIWLRCYPDIYGMCKNQDEAETQAKDHKKDVRPFAAYRVKHLDI